MQKLVSNFIYNCIFIFLDNCVFSPAKLYVYSPSYKIFRTHISVKKYIYFIGCICIYSKTNCLCPSLLVDIHLIFRVGGYAATTPAKRYLILNFTSFGCSDENNFGIVQIKYILHLQCLNQQYYFFVIKSCCDIYVCKRSSFVVIRKQYKH